MKSYAGLVGVSEGYVCFFWNLGCFNYLGSKSEAEYQELLLGNLECFHYCVMLQDLYNVTVLGAYIYLASVR